MCWAEKFKDCVAKNIHISMFWAKNVYKLVDNCIKKQVLSWKVERMNEKYINKHCSVWIFSFTFWRKNGKLNQETCVEQKDYLN